MARQHTTSEKMRREEFSKLTIEESISSKSWDARKHGYEALATIFKDLEPRSPHWERLSFLVKFISEERNVPALEKGLEAALTFVQMCGNMKDETVADLLNGIILRCLADQKLRIRDLATRICMTLFEKRKHELVMITLLDGLEGRNAKQAFACIRTLTSALKLFGPSIVDVPLITTKVVNLCANKSMFQREVKDLLIEIYAFIGPGIRDLLTSLDLSQLKTMDIEFAKADEAKGEKITTVKTPIEPDRQPSATRNQSTGRPTSTKSVKNQPNSTSSQNRPVSSKSQTQKKVAERLKSPRTERLNCNTSSGMAGKTKEDRGACGDRFSTRNRYARGNIVQPQIGLDDIFLMIESKQWGDRKDALEELSKIINSDRIFSPTTYNKMITSLRHLILTDTNVLLISKAVQCVTVLAKKEDQAFRPHAPLMMTLLLEKFKEKKSVLVEALREATDAIYLTTPFATIARYISISMAHQNPAVKSEAELLLWRCFSNPIPEILKMNNWVQMVDYLVKNLAYPDQNVRQNAMKALGAMMKVVGEHNLSPLLRDVQRHHMNMISNFGDEAATEYRQPNSSIGNDDSYQSDTNDAFVDDLNKGKTKSARTGTGGGKEPTKFSSTVYTAEETVILYSSDEHEPSSNSQCTDERFYDAQELSLSEGYKGRNTTSPKTVKKFFHSNESTLRVDVSKSSKTKSAKAQEDDRQSRPKTANDPSANSSESRKGSLKRKSRNKPLSPVAQQRLNSLRSKLDQLRSMWSDIQNPRSPTNSAKRKVEQEIAKKLENLENNVDTCFKEISQLSPLLYEMTEPESQTSESPTVLREFNKRLIRMEGQLKSMTFNENVQTASGNVPAVPLVIRQGNGNWFVEEGY